MAFHRELGCALRLRSVIGGSERGAKLLLGLKPVRIRIARVAAPRVDLESTEPDGVFRNLWRSCLCHGNFGCICLPLKNGRDFLQCNTVGSRFANWATPIERLEGVGRLNMENDESVDGRLLLESVQNTWSSWSKYGLQAVRSQFENLRDFSWEQSRPRKDSNQPAHPDSKTWKFVLVHVARSQSAADFEGIEVGKGCSLRRVPKMICGVSSKMRSSAWETGALDDGASGAFQRARCGWPFHRDLGCALRLRSVIGGSERGAKLLLARLNQPAGSCVVPVRIRIARVARPSCRSRKHGAGCASIPSISGVVLLPTTPPSVTQAVTSVFLVARRGLRTVVFFLVVVFFVTFLAILGLVAPLLRTHGKLQSLQDPVRLSFGGKLPKRLAITRQSGKKLVPSPHFF